MKDKLTSEEKQLFTEFPKLLTCNSLQQLCDYCGELFDCGVLVTTNDHYILAKSHLKHEDNLYHLEETYPYFPPVQMNKREATGVSYGFLPQPAGEMMPVAVVRIASEKLQLGILYMLAPKSDVDIREMPILPWIIRAFTTFLMPMHLQFQHGDPISSFFSQLISGETCAHNEKTETILNQRMKELGICMDDHKYVAVLRVIPAQYKQFMEFQAIKDELAAIVPNSYIFAYDNNLCIVFSRHKLIPAISQYLEALCEYVENHGLLCGVSSNFGTILELKHWYQYAQDVIDQGLRMDEKESIYCFDDYMHYMLLRVCDRNTNLKDFCSPAIKGLLFYDECHGTNHLLTLHTYLTHRQKVTLTAEALQCHRNTVKYRINQICELFQLDLSDGTAVYPLVRSLEILQYLGQLPKPPDVPLA